MRPAEWLLYMYTSRADLLTFPVATRAWKPREGITQLRQRFVDHLSFHRHCRRDATRRDREYNTLRTMV